MVKVWRVLLCVLLGSLVVSCSPKKNAAIASPQTSATQVEPVATTPSPSAEVPVITEYNQEPERVVQQPEPEPQPEPTAPVQTTYTPEPVVEDTHHHHDPRELLEGALETCEAALTKWRSGDLEEALNDMDSAYAMILKVDAERHPDLLQEKEDLRYLISKRIVEIHASRHTAVGDLSKSIPLVMNEHVAAEIKSFQGRERKQFLEAYKRSGHYRTMILEALHREGMPEQLSWLPLIESLFKPRALSRARALGLWQFIPSTGYRYGLTRDQWVDERMDHVEATDAALNYLIDLHNLFGDWMSALAGYNCGEGRVLRAIKSQHINYLDNFWDLYEMLPRETARYVPRFMATLFILEDPAKYGFELPEVYPPLEFDTIRVNRSVKLSDLDTLAGVESGTFKLLNTKLRFGSTPTKEFELRVPKGTAELVNDGIAGLPRYEIPADAYVTHRVRRGESLSAIASRYRSSISAIVRANNLRNQHRIWPGQRLKIPGRGGAPVRATASTQSSKGRYHQVVRGDSLWKVAKRYGTTVNRLTAWNNLSSNRLSLGQRLLVSKPAPATASVDKSARTYKVRRGDTLGKIAQRHGVTLAALLRANNLTKRDKIYPTQTLVVPR